MDSVFRPRPMQDQMPAGRPGTQHPYARARLNNLVRRIEDGLAATVAAFDAPAPTALAAILRGLDHPWPVLKALLSQRFGETPPPETADASWWRHRRLRPGTARRLIRFAAMPLGCAAFLDATEADDRSSTGSGP